MTKSDLETGATIKVPHICIRDTVELQTMQDGAIANGAEVVDVRGKLM
jgi:hypothetical protein